MTLHLNFGYSKVGNKTSVVDDGNRDSINFTQISDVEPLLARYMLLQQFDGKPLLSYATISRAMDDYFENYWGNLPGDLGIGGGTPKIPWLRIGDSNNKLDVGADGLSMTLEGVTSKLSPIDSVINIAFDTMIAEVATLTPIENIDSLIDKINVGYSDVSDKSGVVLGEDFEIVDNTLVLTIDDTVYPINWATVLSETMVAADKVISDTMDIPEPFGTETSQKAILELYEDTLTNNDSNISYSLDQYLV